MYRLPFSEGRPAKDGNIRLANGATTGQFILSHNSDTQVPAYKITTGYKPTYKGSASYPDGTPIKMSDFYSTTNTDSDSYKDWMLIYNKSSQKFAAGIPAYLHKNSREFANG